MKKIKPKVVDFIPKLIEECKKDRYLSDQTYKTYIEQQVIYRCEVDDVILSRTLSDGLVYKFVDAQLNLKPYEGSFKNEIKRCQIAISEIDRRFQYLGKHIQYISSRESIIEKNSAKYAQLYNTRRYVEETMDMLMQTQEILNKRIDDYEALFSIIRGVQSQSQQEATSEKGLDAVSEEGLEDTYPPSL